MTLLEGLRAEGVSVEVGDTGRLRLPAATPIALIERARADRDALLVELQDQAEARIACWPLEYRRWMLSTVAYLLQLGKSRPEAFWRSFHSVGQELHSLEPMTAAACAWLPTADHPKSHPGLESWRPGQGPNGQRGRR